MKKYLALLSAKTKAKCGGIILLACIASVFASIWPIRLGDIYTGVSSGELCSITQIVKETIVFGIIFLLAECISIVRRVLLDCVIAEHEAQVREESVEKLLKMPVAYYSGCLSGEKTAQINQGVSGLSQLIKILCNDIFATVFTAVCTLVQVIVHAPGGIAGIIFLYLLITVLISIIQIRSQNGIREKIIARKNALEGQFCQSIGNLELIRAMNAQKYEKKRLKPDIYQISAVEKKHHCYMGMFDCMKQFSKIAFQVIVLLVSALMIGRGDMAPGAVITVCLLFQQLVKPIDEVYRFMDEMASSAVKARILVNVAAAGEDSVFTIASQNQAPEDTGITFKKVIITNPEKDKSLAYYDNLYIPGGKIVAMQGASGSGKTTLMRGLCRYYPYVSGSISLFGHDLELYSQQELSELLFYVPQQAFFFAGTIRENLVYGLGREVSEMELIDALRKVCLLETLVNKVSAKDASAAAISENILAYRIGEGGAGLSGGERQRLSIARAFLRNPRIYIFDESTANLDEATEKKVLRNIEEYARKNSAGIVYISHDETVIKRCEEVILVENKIDSIAEKEAA